MPKKKSALKDLRKSKKSAIKNAKVKKNIKVLTKKTLKSIEGKNMEDMKKYAALAIKSIDKAVQKKIVKKNTGARKKSSLIRQANKMGK